MLDERKSLKIHSIRKPQSTKTRNSIPRDNAYLLVPETACEAIEYTRINGNIKLCRLCTPQNQRSQEQGIPKHTTGSKKNGRSVLITFTDWPPNLGAREPWLWQNKYPPKNSITDGYLQKECTFNKENQYKIEQERPEEESTPINNTTAIFLQMEQPYSRMIQQEKKTSQ